MRLIQFSILPLLLIASPICEAQPDSISATLQQVPIKYFHSIDNKIEKYSKRITGKTEKTLAKLSRWENKIKSLLNNVSPESAQKLFGKDQPTFSTLLRKLQEGKTLSDEYKVKYNEYFDNLTTSIHYLENQKENMNKNLQQKVNSLALNLNDLEADIANTETTEAFIKERKKLLANEVAKHLSKNKYLAKIDKESYYYTESILNYKALFSDKKKAEELAIKLLNKIPAFTRFAQDNNMLAQLFASPNYSASMANLQGLQTRASVTALIQNQIASGGPGAQELFQQNFQQALAEINTLKDKVLNAGGSNSDMNIPDFKPNQQRSKTFMQRLEYGYNFQPVKANAFVPGGVNIGMSIGYKLNDKSVLGIGAGYILGVGTIDKIKFSNNGIGLRSFIDWKIKKQFFVSGGFEMNYNTVFKNIDQLRERNAWQQSGLLGISKKVEMKSKLMKGGKLQLMYDFLYRQHLPVSQPIVFRVGYNF